MSAVADAYALDGIRVLVVGVDVPAASVGLAGEDSPAQADRFAALGEVALVGGMPFELGMGPQKFFEVRHIEDIVEALEPMEGLIECSIDLTMIPLGPPPPQQIPLVNVELDGTPIPYVQDCANDDGWTWSVEGEWIAFCGSWCQPAVAGALTITYDCPLGEPAC